DGPGPPGDDQSVAPDGVRRPGHLPAPEAGRPGNGLPRGSAAIPTRTPPGPPPKKPGIPKLPLPPGERVGVRGVSKNFTSPLAGEVGPKGRVGRLNQDFTSPHAGEVAPKGRVGGLNEDFTSPLAGEVGPKGRVGRSDNR